MRWKGDAALAENTPLTLGRLRADVFHRKGRREVHVLPVEHGVETLHGLCGEPLRVDSTEYVTVLGDDFCVPCQLLAPEPDWVALRGVPYWPARGFSNSGV